MTLGEKVRQARKNRGITQRALAGGDLSESFISMLEHDKVRPSLETLRILAGRLSVPVGDLLDADPPPRKLAAAKLELGNALLRRNSYTEAMEAFQDAERASADDASLEFAFRIHNGIGQALMGMRQFDLARDHLERAQTIADALGRPDLLSRVAGATGILCLRQRDFPAARDAFTRGLAALRSASPIDPEIEGSLMHSLGRAYSEMGLLAQAMECYQVALQRLEPLGDVATMGLVHFNLGVAHERQRSFDLARLHLEKAATLFEAQENLQLLASVKRSLGIMLIDRGRPEEAAEILEQCLAIATRTADDIGRAKTLTELARVSMMNGDLGTARTEVEEAIRLAVKVQDPAEAALAESVMAAICQREGRLDEAAHRYAYALEQFERLKMSTEVARVSRDYGFLLLERGEESPAAQYFARAFRAQEAAAAAR
ncbi:MAG: tetratricopeptide repeat protein [bacterium]